MNSKTSRLEDYGARGVVSPQERFAQYRLDCKALPRAKKALFWLRTLEADPEVARIQKDMEDE